MELATLLPGSAPIQDAAGAPAEDPLAAMEELLALPAYACGVSPPPRTCSSVK